MADEGIAEGFLQGRYLVLLRLLCLKFKTLDRASAVRLHVATSWIADRADPCPPVGQGVRWADKPGQARHVILDR